MEQATLTTLPISPGSFWTIVILVIVLVCACLLIALWKSDAPPKDGWRSFVEALGIARFPNYLTMPIVAVWGALFLALLIGIPGVIHGIFFGESATDPVERRWLLLSLTALAAAMGAVVALPFTLIRTKQAERQTKATEEGLITDRINNAVEGLGAEKKVDRIWRPVSLKDAGGNEETLIQWQGETLPEGDVQEKGDWQIFSETLPNLEVRIGGILALERLARNNLVIHVQIMEILCAYIRENAPASGAKLVAVLEMHEDEHDGPLREDWSDRLKTFPANKVDLKPREDIQVALTVLGRRSAQGRLQESRHNNPDPEAVFIFDAPGPEVLTLNDTESIDKEELQNWKRARDTYQGYRLDLRGADLQVAGLTGLNFGGARFEKAWLQGANLSGAQMQGANLSGALMQGANLSGVQMQGANLSGVQMQITVLRRAGMQGSNLSGARMQRAIFEEAQMQGTNLGSARMQGAVLDEARMEGTVLRSARMEGAVFRKAGFDAATALSDAILKKVAVRAVDLTTVPEIGVHLNGMFGDASTTLPPGVSAPSHWPGYKLGWPEFDEEWKKWQADPDKYVPPDPPEPE